MSPVGRFSQENETVGWVEIGFGGLTFFEAFTKEAEVFAVACISTVLYFQSSQV